MCYNKTSSTALNRFFCSEVAKTYSVNDKRHSDLFFQVSTDISLIPQIQPASKADINTANILRYIDILEQKINGILGEFSFVKLPSILLFGLFAGMVFTSPANGALSASTANTIKGTAPKFVATSGENKLGFAVQGINYSEQAGNIASSSVKLFSGDLTFSDFVVKTLTAGDFVVATDYLDDDGDGADPTAPFTLGTTSYVWKDNSNIVIPTSAYDNIIGCGSGYAMPLKLEIMTSNVGVHSQYGDPRDSAPVTLTKVYYIASVSRICYAKPNQMKMSPDNAWLNISSGWNSGISTPDVNNGGGYSADFDPINGFKADAVVKFPTTGFPNAQFQLIMTGSQTDYNYTVPVNPGAGVSVDTLGNVKLTSKPTGAVTVRATLKTNTSVYHDYVFNPTGVWALPQAGIANWASSQSKCGGAENVLTRQELTNSPRNTAPMGWSYSTNYYTRAIGGGVFGEWGKVESSQYPGSLWAGTSYYWTPEVHTSGSNQFVVLTTYGRVYYISMSRSYYIACRG